MSCRVSHAGFGGRIVRVWRWRFDWHFKRLARSVWAGAERKESGRKLGQRGSPGPDLLGPSVICKWWRAFPRKVIRSDLLVIGDVRSRLL